MFGIADLQNSGPES